jgi:hypothetical protein
MVILQHWGGEFSEMEEIRLIRTSCFQFAQYARSPRLYSWSRDLLDTGGIQKRMYIFL